MQHRDPQNLADASRSTRRFILLALLAAALPGGVGAREEADSRSIRVRKETTPPSAVVELDDGPEARRASRARSRVSPAEKKVVVDWRDPAPLSHTGTLYVENRSYDNADVYLSPDGRNYTYQATVPEGYRLVLRGVPRGWWYFAGTIEDEDEIAWGPIRFRMRSRQRIVLMP